MPGIVTVTALYDNDKNFYPNGKTFAIPTDSLVMPNTVPLPITHVIPGATTPINYYPLLEVKTKEVGSLFLNITLVQYAALVRAADQNNQSKTIISTVSGASLTDPYFINAIHTISTEGQDYQIGADFTQNTITQTITWVNGNSFSITQVLTASI